MKRRRRGRRIGGGEKEKGRGRKGYVGVREEEEEITDPVHIFHTPYSLFHISYSTLHI